MLRDECGFLDEKNEAFTTMPYNKPSLPFRSIENSPISSQENYRNKLQSAENSVRHTENKKPVLQESEAAAFVNNIFSPTSEMRTGTARLSPGNEKEHRPMTKENGSKGKVQFKNSSIQIKI